MVAVRAHEHDHLLHDEGNQDRPNLWLVSAPDVEPPRSLATVERQTGVELSKLGDVVVNIVMEVDDQPYELSVNVSTGKLGNGSAVETFFKRFEYERQNPDGTLSGDFGRAADLAAHAMHLARQR